MLTAFAKKFFFNFIAKTANTLFLSENLVRIIFTFQDCIIRLFSLKHAMYTITDGETLRFAIKDYLRFYTEERIQERYDCKTPLEV